MKEVYAIAVAVVAALAVAVNVFAHAPACVADVAASVAELSVAAPV
jgi:hypothetical protein